MSRQHRCAALIIQRGAAALLFAALCASASEPGETAPHPGMVFIPSSTYRMGADHAEGTSGKNVKIPALWIDRTEVTNADFERFVHATRYVTTAEKTDANGNPAGSSMLVEESGTRIWRIVPGANWQHPDGPQSTVHQREHYPVVHVSWFDAVAYAAWCGKRLPTSAEWECAARGGLAEQRYPWGDVEPDKGGWRANVWQGDFPTHDRGDDGFTGLAPVASFPANAYGCFDMAGNVWEWCSDSPVKNAATADPTALQPQRGGSFLCARGVCHGYRVASAGSSTAETSAMHVGFRCVVSAE